MSAEHVSQPHLSVVIPAYNEEERLGRSLPMIAAYLDEQNIDAEILVVDDGSTDGTVAVAERALQSRRGRVLRNPDNRGKGYSIRHGVSQARGRWILMTDADLSAPIEEHAKLAAVARDMDVDVAIGSRALDESRIEIRQNPVREIMGKTFNKLIRLFTGLPFHDTQCGFKLMDRERTRPVFELMRVDGFAFDVELLFLSVRFGLAVKEVPVVWRNDPRSQVSIVADPIRMLLDVLRIRWRFRRGLYNPEAKSDGA